jgi:hypothetical protein
MVLALVRIDYVLLHLLLLLEPHLFALDVLGVTALLANLFTHSVVVYSCVLLAAPSARYEKVIALGRRYHIISFNLNEVFFVNILALNTLAHGDIHTKSLLRLCCNFTDFRRVFPDVRHGRQ